ncbi:hypothetical protein LXL04_016338 [Taraxacum kok-saghyz]
MDLANEDSILDVVIFRLADLFKLNPDRISSERFRWDWKRDPRGAIALNELLQLYHTIGTIEVIAGAAKSKLGFSFVADSDGYEAALITMVSLGFMEKCWMVSIRRLMPPICTMGAPMLPKHPTNNIKNHQHTQHLPKPTTNTGSKTQQLNWTKSEPPPAPNYQTNREAPTGAKTSIKPDKATNTSSTSKRNMNPATPNPEPVATTAAA